MDQKEWEAARAAKALMLKQVSAWVTVVAFFVGMLLAVLIGGTAEHQTGLAAFLWGLPLFAIQVLALILLALLIDFVASELRTMAWYDRNGPSRELKMVQDRCGTEEEKPGDADALARQFMARNVLIAAVIILFALLHSA